jgi:thioredoxin-like negative regulator of GroEL
MVKKIFGLLFIVSMGQFAWSAADEVSEALAKAEALYYEADFTKSIELLLTADQLLQSQKDHLQEKVRVKLQLALAYIGLNKTDDARTRFRELYELDADYTVDPEQFSPKVVSMADQAKFEQNETRCRAVLADAQQQLGRGNAQRVLQLISSSQPKCSGLAALTPNAAELFFKEGMDAYRKSQLTEALAKFRTALQLHPEHELASQYAELTASKLQLDADRVLLAWRKDFAAGDYSAATANFRQLVLAANADTTNQVREEYRTVLSSLVQSWNRACANHDAVTMDKIRGQINDLLPDPSIGEDLLEKMTNCTNTGCVPMSAQLVLARLKSRVDPDFPPYVRNQIKVSPVTVRMKAKISETGDVVSSEPQGGNAILYGSVRAAFDRWKFSPAVIQGAPRCIETEIPIVINFVPAN